VVWDRKGEERMRVIKGKGMGREEGKGRKEERKEEEDNLAPKTIPRSAIANGNSHLDHNASIKQVPFVDVGICKENFRVIFAPKRT
jgi:hypothetical protein